MGWVRRVNVESRGMLIEKALIVRPSSKYFVVNRATSAVQFGFTMYLNLVTNIFFYYRPLAYSMSIVLYVNQ